jgi:hypothetical protein
MPVVADAELPRQLVERRKLIGENARWRQEKKKEQFID